MKNDRSLHILVYRLSALGDVAMTIPAIYSVARAYPMHRFHVATSKFCTQLFINTPENVEVHPVDASAGIWSLLKALHQLPIDAVADVHNVLRSWLVDASFLLKGKRVSMLAKDRQSRKAILKNKESAQKAPSMTPANATTSFTQRYFDVFRMLGLPCKPTFTSLFMQRPTLPIDLTKGDEQWIGIAPFARYQSKIYPPDKMREVVVRLASRPRTRIFLFGSRGKETEALQQWAQASPMIMSVAGRFSLQKELALMAHLDTMVTMDSANMHMASLVGTRVVSIWGGTTPACGFMGWGQRTEDAVCQHLACQPCTTAGSNECWRKDFACMASIEPETIVRTICSR